MQGSGKSAAYDYMVDAMLALESKEREADKFGQKSQPAHVPETKNNKKLKTEQPCNLTNYQRVIVECTKQGSLHFHISCSLQH